MKTQYLVLMLSCLSGLTIRTGYEYLKLAGRVSPKNKSVFVTVFVGMGAMLLSWPFMGYFDPVPLQFHDIGHWAGAGAIITGLCLVIAGVVQLRGLENIKSLVASGIYAKLRHPMYTGFIFWILGWISYHGAMTSLVLGIISIANILYWRRIEEKKLMLQFEEAYQNYKQKTWF